MSADLQSAGLGLPQWLDTPWWLDPKKVKAMGYAGINRYMCADRNTGPGSHLPQKRVTYPELQGMLDAGLDFTWNYEDAAGDYNLGYAVWLERGKRAADYGFRILQLPDGTGCYGSCDMDVGWQMSMVQLESQHGFRDGYQLGPAGIYGSTVAINNTTKAGTASLGWITLAKSWNHGVPAASGAAHLDQVGSAFAGAADTNNVLQVPHATYLQALGEDSMTPEDLQQIRSIVNEEVRKVLADDTHDYVRDSVRQWATDMTHPDAPVVGRAAGVGVQAALADDFAALSKQLAALGLQIAGLPPGQGGVAPDYESEPITITLIPKAAP